MKLIKQVEHPDVKIHIYESFDESLSQIRYSYEYITSSETITGGWGPSNEIIYNDMASAITAAHSLLPDGLKDLMKLEYLLM